MNTSILKEPVFDTIKRDANAIYKKTIFYF